MCDAWKKKLLDPTIEYANHADDAATLGSVGLEPARTRDEIAAEYGRVLKQFLAA